MTTAVSTAPKTANRKTFRGTVVSDKMQDTAIVAVSRFVKHPKYKKYLKRTSRFAAHNPGNRAKEGEVVMIRSTRPLSKTKSFEIIADERNNATADTRGHGRTSAEADKQ